jgi:aspartyl aminopeptidase
MLLWLNFSRVSHMLWCLICWYALFLCSQAPKPAPAAAAASGAAPAATPTNGTSAAAAAAPGNVVDNHHAALLALVAEQLGCAAEDIVDFELNLCDVQPGVLGGAAEEFVFVGRLDNLASCYTALEVRVCLQERRCRGACTCSKVTAGA